MKNRKNLKKRIVNYFSNLDPNVVELGDPRVHLSPTLLYIKTKNKSAVLVFDDKSGYYFLAHEGMWIPLKTRTMNSIFRRVGLLGQQRPRSCVKYRKKKIKRLY